MPVQKPQGPIASTLALARHLGLSRWTVSRVLNGHPEVKSETSQRVRAAMEELGFVPSPVGRALRGSRTGMVGVCFQAIGSPVVARKIATLQRVLREAGYRALFEVTDGDPSIEIEVVRQFVSMKLDGLVLVGGFTDANAAAIRIILQQHAVPVVLVDPMREFELATVEVDRMAGMGLALEHLVKLGHKRFALLGIDENVVYGRIRCDGVRRFAAENNLSWTEQFVRLSEDKPIALDFAYGRRLGEQFLNMRNRPTAVIALNDQIAIGAMTLLQQTGLAVPRDVSVVGFDNLDVGAHVNPRLTTIEQHVEQLMVSAVELLTGQSQSPRRGSPERRLVEPALVVGASSGTAPRARR